MLFFFGFHRHLHVPKCSIGDGVGEACLFTAPPVAEIIAEVGMNIDAGSMESVYGYFAVNAFVSFLCKTCNAWWFHTRNECVSFVKQG